MQKKYYFCAQIWTIMQRKLILMALAAFFALVANAQTVNYLTTEQFKQKVFNYTTEKEWKYKGDKPCHGGSKAHRSELRRFRAD